MTCRSPTTGLLCLQASSDSAPFTLVTRQSLAHTLGPALIIMNTVGRGDELMIGLQVEEEQELEQILEKAVKKATQRPHLPPTHPRHRPLRPGIQASQDTKSRRLWALPACS